MGKVAAKAPLRCHLQDTFAYMPVLPPPTGVFVMAAHIPAAEEECECAAEHFRQAFNAEIYET